MTPLDTIAVAATIGVPLGALWGAASYTIARRYRRRLDQYDDALLAVANEGRDQ